jgi:hypothetical protein
MWDPRLTVDRRRAKEAKEAKEAAISKTIFALKQCTVG